MDPEIAEMERFLDPEIVKMVRFLDPEISKMVDRTFMDLPHMASSTLGKYLRQLHH